MLVTCIAKTEDGKKYALGTKNGYVLVFNDNKGSSNRCNPKNKGKGAVRTIDFSSKGDKLIVGYEKFINEFNLAVNPIDNDAFIETNH
jgi:WD40 repeat protein